MEERKWHDILVYGPGDEIPSNAVVVNPTSRSNVEWSKGLSPFFLGPVGIYDGTTAKNFENAWQYSKCYPCHSTDPNFKVAPVKNQLPDLNSFPSPGPEYFQWAKKGWANPKADRFPQGPGAIPLYSYWDKRKMGYIEGRINIYCPLYAAAVEKTPAWAKLKELYLKTKAEGKLLVLFDFDGHNSIETFNGDYEKILYNYQMKMGHAFVLAMMLENKRLWEEPYQPQKVHWTYVKKRI